MSIILAIETATERASIALLDGDQLVFEISLRAGRDLSRGLIPAIQQSFLLSRRSFNEIEAVAVSIGPGSFTGLRVGVTAAKTIAYALSSPCVAVPTLQALAHNVTLVEPRTIVAAMDARRGEFFAAAFQPVTRVRGSVGDEMPLTREQDAGDTMGHSLQQDAGDTMPLSFSRTSACRLQQIAPEQLVPADNLAEWSAGFGPCVIVVGGSLPDSVLEMSSDLPIVPAYPQARDGALIGLENLILGETVTPAQLAPFYLRRSYAEESTRG